MKTTCGNYLKSVQIKIAFFILTGFTLSSCGTMYHVFNDGGKLPVSVSSKNFDSRNRYFVEGQEVHLDWQISNTTVSGNTTTTEYTENAIRVAPKHKYVTIEVLKPDGQREAYLFRRKVNYGIYFLDAFLTASSTGIVDIITGLGYNWELVCAMNVKNK